MTDVFAFIYYCFFCLDRKSFPSQHATLSAFAAVYVSVRKSASVPQTSFMLHVTLGQMTLVTTVTDLLTIFVVSMNM